MIEETTLNALRLNVGFDTIVVDPPWPMRRPPGGAARSKGFRGEVGMPYPTMTVDEIKCLPVNSLAKKDAHLYLWTTQLYLEESRDIARAWGFRVAATLVWCKPKGGFVGGPFYPNIEFVLFCRRGKLKTKKRINSQWFDWPRGRHSAKPEKFQDMVEEVSPGTYLELFARRKRDGWAVWGNEVESDIEIVTPNAEGKRP